MNRHVFITVILLSCFFTAYPQSVEITGQLKVSDVPANNTSNDIVVRNANGTLEKRDASTLGGIPSSAIVLSETENNTTLTNAGFTNTGYMNISLFPKSNGTINYGEWSGTTSLITAPESRNYHSAIWTGSEMIIWGGTNVAGNYLNTGARYNPTTNSWNIVTTTNAPEARSQHTAVWTGTEMIIWGGRTGSSSYTNTGSKYNPVTDTWTTISVTNAPIARTWHSGLWTGTELIVWGGGISGSYYNTGGKYNPITDTWTSMTTTSAPTGRTNFTMVWTGSEIIVWGGYTGSATNTGGKYNPLTDIWTTTSTTLSPTARHAHVAVWNGNEMIVWGGYSGSTYFNSGGKYNPVTDTWLSTSTLNAPEGRYYAQSVWTGSEMIAWGGGRDSGTLFYDTGGKYNPVTDTWLATPMLNVPLTRRFFTSVWTGSEMIVWGGFSSIGNLTNTGGLFNPNLPGYAPASTAVRFLYKKN